jgi:hypothetical protein
VRLEIIKIYAQWERASLYFCDQLVEKPSHGQVIEKKNSRENEHAGEKFVFSAFLRSFVCRKMHLLVQSNEKIKMQEIQTKQHLPHQNTPLRE